MKEVRATISANEFARMTVKYQLTRPLMIVCYIILKVCGLGIILINNEGLSDIILGVFFIIVLELMLLLMYFRTKISMKRLYGETYESIHQLDDDVLIYMVPNRKLTIPWKDVTSVKVTKSYITIYKDKVVMHRIASSKKRMDNYRILREYMFQMSKDHNFKFY